MDATERVDVHWSGFLGIPVSALQNPGVVITPHAALRGYRGVWFFVRGRSAVVSAPAEWVVPLQQKLGSAVAQDLLSLDSVVRVIGRAAGEVVGPSYQGWLSADRFRPVASDGVRRLPESDAEPVRVFQSSCPHEDWDHSGIDPAAARVWASFQESKIVALGQLRPLSDGVVDPCVITHPDHRRHGHGLRLMSAMAQAALSEGRLVLYQTLLANTPALSLAHQLGFSRYATLVAVRLAPDTG